MDKLPSQAALTSIDEANKSLDPNQFDSFMKELFGNKNLSMKTDLKGHQVVQFARGRLFEKTKRCKSMGFFLTYLEKYSVSKNRKGRTESVDIHKASHHDPFLDSSIRGKLFGG